MNLATMRVDRTGRHKDALMTIEADEPVGDAVWRPSAPSPGCAGRARIEKIA